MKIYVASSWRNAYQPSVVSALRAAGHEVYDFRNPPGRTGFAWSAIDPAWEGWTVEQYKAALQHPLAGEGFGADANGMEEADLCVLVLPSGRSAHLEAGWFTGRDRDLVVFSPEPCEPELMYLLAGHPSDCIAATMAELLAKVAAAEDGWRRALDETRESYARGHLDDAAACGAIRSLCREEGAAVTVLSANPDADEGDDAEAVEVTASWTGWKPERFGGPTLSAALIAAVTERDHRKLRPASGSPPGRATITFTDCPDEDGSNVLGVSIDFHPPVKRDQPIGPAQRMGMEVAQGVLGQLDGLPAGAVDAIDLSGGRDLAPKGVQPQ